ncbi:hypothetical protein ACFU6S_04810 [Streptomyces sp. NPDC057456]|uniref:hypothetical protein n=1 Tax=Streptomyces sp. NPDC057456 TaxID=3346139 RepID=UPI0036AB96E9
MNLRSSWVAETGQTREDTRLTQLGATTPANPLDVRSGILPGSYDGQYRLSGFWLEGGAGTMTATVHEGRAVVQADSNQGAYPVTLAEPITLTFADGDASYGRIDVVVLRVYDDLYDDSGFTKAAVEIVRGTPAATPVVPALPEIALPVYQVAVRAGISAGKGGVNWSTDVTDLRTPTVAVGGILPVYGDTGNGAYPGQYRDSGGALQRWDGSAWVSYPSALGGIAPSGAVATASYTGQYRDSPAGLQRWNGTTWVTYQPVPTWTNYTPVWRCETGAAPVLGNGTLAGAYVKTGTVVTFRIYLKIGSTTNLSAQDANGDWTFSLPAAPVSTAWKLDGRVLNAEAFDDSTSLTYQGSGLLAVANGGVVRSLRDTLKTSNSSWDKSLPFAWAVNDILSVHGTYESAS